MAANPWTAERSVLPDEAQRLIAAQFPELAPVGVEMLGAGWDNTAFCVNGAYVFRFPRRQFAVQFMEAEIRLMPAIAPRLRVPVPSPRFIGQAADGYPWPFAGYPLIPGRTACVANLDVGSRRRLAKPLGHFLGNLHRIPAEYAREHGASGDTLGRLSVSRRSQQTRERLIQLAALGLIDDAAPFLHLLAAAPADYTPRTDTLVHGDLYARHILVGPENQLAGIIDWGDVHLGDPAVDLAIALSLLPPSAREDFALAYGEVSPATWAMACFRALFHATALATYAHDVNDQALLREAMASLQHLLAGE